MSVLAVACLLLLLAEGHYAVFSKILNALSGSLWETTVICITVYEIKCAVLLLSFIFLPLLSALTKNYTKTATDCFPLNSSFNSLFGS